MNEPNTWHLWQKAPPYKMLICAIGAEQLPDHDGITNWFYFIGYYSPEENAFFCPATKTKFCSKLVDAWRIFDHTLEHLTMDLDCQEQRANH